VISLADIVEVSLQNLCSFLIALLSSSHTIGCPFLWCHVTHDIHPRSGLRYSFLRYCSVLHRYYFRSVIGYRNSKYCWLRWRLTCYNRSKVYLALFLILSMNSCWSMDRELRTLLLKYYVLLSYFITLCLLALPCFLLDYFLHQLIRWFGYFAHYLRSIGLNLN